MLKPNITATPFKSNIDEDVDIKISGCQSREKVTIKAFLFDDRHEPFISEATFLADEQGKLDLGRNAPIEGTYTGVDQNGLFWSAVHQKKKHDDYYMKSNTNDVKISVQLLIENKLVDEVEIVRSFYQEDVRVTKVNEKGIVGTIFQPKKKGNFPNVILLAGSDGGSLASAASLLASQGYCVFDLAYFNQEGVPKNLESIPLEYFEQAIQLLQTQTNNQDKVALIGYSRGAELALLLASEFNQFSAVIAGAPGAYITSGLRNSIFAPIPSWTFKNQAKPYLKFQHRPTQMFGLMKNWFLRKPASFLGIWDDSLKKIDELEEMRIKVENIKAPVLLVSGDKDQIWPASMFADIIKRKLPRVEHLQYEHGGHFIAFPYALPHLPANIYEHVGGGMVMDSGGTKKANACAAKDSWPVLLNFIRKHAHD
ncbi:acyl-CoA thioesterase/bile acid-CoA:amino acid N-acyltransferase family protein [Alkalihalobacillus pseudalcaliphilus]|uniref:acyl-CoA thioesterase/bile acid-CoA:amino acid N-acyltransferase family protein n=1 Tax=Alkalihalobacillus pseudalcaliphilus TaxID=79884 RepID=UPI00064E10E7|nr:acyl-CoA thioesterase/bile acid-CoA:amino acid N-acyltransferase family protein [Alkalihalobacillus pseudalcaliphilus]KMK75327.1 hypothetical protein AB990_18110 [Alkalihalobacillus pseudalcaliphilus]